MTELVFLHLLFLRAILFSFLLTLQLYLFIIVFGVHHGVVHGFVQDDRFVKDFWLLVVPELCEEQKLLVLADDYSELREARFELLQTFDVFGLISDGLGFFLPCLLLALLL